MSSPDPLQEIHVAVNRRLSPFAWAAPAPRKPNAPSCRTRRCPWRSPLAAFTTGVALRQPPRAGSWARCAPATKPTSPSYSQDIFAVPPTEIGDTQVDLTIAGGQVVHEAASAPA